MASYKQPCRHCGGLIESESQACPLCGGRHPFGDCCPYCHKEVKRSFVRCPSCEKPLTVFCPHCGAQTFAGDSCSVCKKSLLVRCKNKRCIVPQFFMCTMCTACGKKMPKDHMFVND